MSLLFEIIPLQLSYSDFKEISINNPGTSAFYGSDDLNEIMRIFNAKVVSNRLVKIKNPFQFQDNFDVVAAATIPSNPGANTKRFYVDPDDGHFKMKSSAGAILDFDVLGAGAQGEANTVSNIGAAGQGFYKTKQGVDLQFRKLNVASNKLSVALDSANDEIDIDANESNFTLQNMGGILDVPRGGTGVNTLPANSLLKGNGTSPIQNIAAGTDGNILTMIGGAPTWASASASADIKTAIFEAGTQIGTVGRRLNFSNASDFTITEDVANDRFNIAYVRSEVLVADWYNPSCDRLNPTIGASANLGTTYVGFSTSGGDVMAVDVDGTGKREFRFYVSWDKNGGLGTHFIRVATAAGEVLAEIPNLVSGRNVITGTLPAAFQDTTKTVWIQTKTSNSTDSPVFRAAHLHFK